MGENRVRNLVEKRPLVNHVRERARYGVTLLDAKKRERNTRPVSSLASPKKGFDAEGGTRTRTPLRTTDFLTTTAFAA
jgi:hypothetical protein